MPLFIRLQMGILLAGLALWGCDTAHGGDGPGEDSTLFSTDADSDSFDEASTDSTRDAGGRPVLGEAPPETAYDGFEEQYILTSSDDPEDVCRVRYELHAVAEPAVPCPICEWDVVVERRNPSVVVNLNNACERSELGLSAAVIAAREGERVAYGFAAESVGHANILMRFNTDSGTWEALTVSNWDTFESRFRYRRRDGLCAYAGPDDATPTTPGICGISGEASVIPPEPGADRE